ncbi:hypothetical protein [Variovorax sp. CY25R-8]|jgi:uncharacterized protein (DUF1778 family)|uniref:hypothetical protein n=1 Tax=Variovorax sp. CY25R-8 TaxID=2855501 RepID=UPI0021BB055E|nr:hypothetical protein [Variovorax sp. CY25R-8]MCT8178116.1 hypothetical protein [Variovorax sp. CY25R-8]
MYPDNKRLRDKRLTVRFDDYEEKLLRALANYLGEQPTTLVRELALRQAEELLGVSREPMADGSVSLPRAAG